MPRLKPQPIGPPPTVAIQVVFSKEQHTNLVMECDRLRREDDSPSELPWLVEQIVSMYFEEHKPKVSRRTRTSPVAVEGKQRPNNKRLGAAA